MAKGRGKWIWAYWGILTLAIGAYLATGLLDKTAGGNPLLAPARAMLLPGATTHAHHQIELACEACHTDPFGGAELIQEACVGCHEAELKEADDSHPASKFDDPRNADRLEKLDAQMCVTCHQEHRPDITHAMGVTLPDDLCFHCHSGEEEMPPDHKDFKFDGCTAAGCHNFHDNRALYEDFLLKHATEPWLLETTQLPVREFATAAQEMMSYPADKYPLQPLTAGQQDAPADHRGDKKVQADWLASAHARNGVNCSACHVPAEGAEQGKWIAKPDQSGCKSCHSKEIEGFLAGKHGSPLAQGLPPMTPAKARIPMRADAHDKELGCTTCHAAHSFDTRKAAVESCMGCHSDQHTQAYKKSPHYALWQKELAGKAPAGSGVSCASCHMPRVRMPTDEGSRLVVQHNQNDTLRPNEKMIRPVCMTCHGLGFSIDAMAAPGLIVNNFSGKPVHHVESIDMAVKKDEETRRERDAKNPRPAEAAVEAGQQVSDF